MNGLRPRQVVIEQVEELKKTAAKPEEKPKPKAQPQMFDVKGGMHASSYIDIQSTRNGC
jgi:hypothetical protein